VDPVPAVVRVGRIVRVVRDRDVGRVVRVVTPAARERKEAALLVLGVLAVPEVVAGLDVRAGLSTNPSGHVSTGQTLFTDTLNTQGSVDGYWLNVPQRGTACPSCVPDGAPQVAVSYLHLLGYTP